MVGAQQKRQVITASPRTKNTGGGSIKVYADKLDILDGDNKSCWEYVKDEYGEMNAKLVGDVRVDVKCVLPVEKLTVGNTYLVYFDMDVDDNKTGFDNTFFEFTDQNSVLNEIMVIQLAGHGYFKVAEFTMTDGTSPNVTARLYDYSNDTKTGLLVKCVLFVPTTN